MPSVGDIEHKYRRNYILVNPDPALGPPTALSSPQEIGTPGIGGGGTGGVSYDFDGVPPIVVDTKPSLGGGRIIVETSMDLTNLDDRASRYTVIALSRLCK